MCNSRERTQEKGVSREEIGRVGKALWIRDCSGERDKGHVLFGEIIQ